MKEVHTLGRSSTAAENQCAKQAKEEDVATNTTLVRYAIHFPSSKVVLYSLCHHGFITKNFNVQLLIKRKKPYNIFQQNN